MQQPNSKSNNNCNNKMTKTTTSGNNIENYNSANGKARAKFGPLSGFGYSFFGDFSSSIFVFF